MSDIALLFDELEERMMKSEEALVEKLSGIRTGKASPALVENITFEYYGTQTRIRDAAGISTPEPRLLVIQPWDGNALKNIEKALLASNIGITPLNDGKTLKLPIPALSEDRRKDLAKQAKAAVEEAKVALRNIRRDGMDYLKKLKKNSEITEDEQKKAEKDLQDMLDKYTKRVDEALAAKEKELMAI